MRGKCWAAHTLLVHAFQEKLGQALTFLQASSTATHSCSVLGAISYGLWWHCTRQSWKERERTANLGSPCCRVLSCAACPAGMAAYSPPLAPLTLLAHFSSQCVAGPHDHLNPLPEVLQTNSHPTARTSRCWKLCHVSTLGCHQLPALPAAIAAALRARFSQEHRRQEACPQD